MNKKVAFIGHRHISINSLKDRLLKVVTEKIKEGYLIFTMGTHGDFDKLALQVCKELRQKYKNIKIEVVLTSLNLIKKYREVDNFGVAVYTPYEDVDTIMYDIEEVYFKKRIIVSNQKMIDSCDTLICYVDLDKQISGAKRAFKYAKKVNKNIINLYLNTDNPFYNKTEEELRKEFLEYCESAKNFIKPS